MCPSSHQRYCPDDPNDPGTIAARRGISVPHAIAFKLSIPVPSDLSYLEDLVFNSMMRTLLDLQDLGLRVEYIKRDPSVGRNLDVVAVSEASAAKGIVLDTYTLPFTEKDHARAARLRRNYALRLGVEQPLPPCVTADSREGRRHTKKRRA